MTPDLDALDRLAHKATPGPWGYEEVPATSIIRAPRWLNMNANQESVKWGGEDDDGRYIAALSPEVVRSWIAYTHGLETALRHISATADTLSPQEFINVCAGALGVDRHEYAGECHPGRSIVELRIKLQRVSREMLNAAGQTTDAMCAEALERYALDIEIFTSRIALAASGEKEEKDGNE